MDPRTVFTMRLEATEPGFQPSGEASYDYDEQLDDVRSVIADACELLAMSEGIAFVVHGFSDQAWSVDVATDLAVVLEQLPEALEALREASDFTIDFYEQGVERALDFHGEGEEIEIECRSGHRTWRPDPQTITIRRDELTRMLRRLAEDFCKLLGSVCQELAEHPWLREWKRAALS